MVFSSMLRLFDPAPLPAGESFSNNFFNLFLFLFRIIINL